MCETEARDLNAVHFSVISEGRPFVALKYALSIDARLSEDPGRPSRISSRRAIVEAHRLRAAHDALLVGIGTVLADDPRLTVREWRPPRRPPARVVLDSRLRLPPGSRLAQTAREAPVWACTAEDASAERAAALTGLGVEILRVVRRKSATDGLDLRAVLAALWDRGVRSVLCEGGGQLGSALLAGGHVNRLYAFLAPRLFGEPGVAGFQGARGRAPREWRLVGRTELDEVTLLTLAPPLVSGEDAGTG